MNADKRRLRRTPRLPNAPTNYRTSHQEGTTQSAFICVYLRLIPLLLLSVAAAGCGHVSSPPPPPAAPATQTTGFYVPNADTPKSEVFPATANAETIAFTDSSDHDVDFIKVLKQLADESGGTFKKVNEEDLESQQ